MSKKLLEQVEKTEIDYVNILEDNQKIAYMIGKYFIATGDKDYIFNYINNNGNIKNNVQNFLENYFLRNLMIKGQILPLSEKDKNYWILLQNLSDVEDKRILDGRKRNIDVEPGKYVDCVQAKKIKDFKFPIAQTFILDNGLKVLFYNNNILPKIDIVLDFKAKYYYDPKDLQGINYFVGKMLLEGTKNYSCKELADIIDLFGIEMHILPGQINMSLLSKDLEKALDILNEILTNAIFEDSAIEKVRNQVLSEIKDFWDQPKQFINLLIKQEVYKNHPFSNSIIGTNESIKKISKQDLITFYKKYFSPKSCKMAIVGNISHIDINAILNSKLSCWNGQEIEDIDFPLLQQIDFYEKNYNITRDQTVLAYAGISVKRLDPEYEVLLVFDQIFSGGVLRSMSSRLFELREQSGLFYTISGSLTSGSNKQPGMIFVRTIVSNDRLKQAEGAIENVINTAIDSLTQDEIEMAKNALVNSLVDNFASNYQTALTFLFIDNFGLNDDYFNHRAQQIYTVDLNSILKTVKKYLNSSKLVKIRVGRV